jgi:hypothetical protein
VLRFDDCYYRGSSLFSDFLLNSWLTISSVRRPARMIVKLNPLHHTGRGGAQLVEADQ